DAALLETDGKSHIKELGHSTLSYDPRFKILLKAAELAVHQANGNLEKAQQFYPAAICIYLTKALNLPATDVLEKTNELTTYLYSHVGKQTTITLTDVLTH